MANVANWPYDLTIRANKAAQATAGTGLTTIIGLVRFKGTINSCVYVPAVGVTGHASNNRIYTLTNLGPGGAGTTAAATLTTTASLVVGTENTITNGTAANRAVSPGDYLALVETVGGSGVADPGGLIHVRISQTT